MRFDIDLRGQAVGKLHAALRQIDQRRERLKRLVRQIVHGHLLRCLADNPASARYLMKSSRRK
jgi:hypothetical protein